MRPGHSNLPLARVSQGQGQTDPVIDGLVASAAGAWSFNTRLRSNYTGNAYRVRRSSDNSTQDIGFVGNRTDTTALLAFCGSGSGFVTTVYDQSGNGRDLIQATTTKQPRVVLSGVVDRPSAGTLPAAQFLSASVHALGRTDGCGISGTQAWTLCGVWLGTSGTAFFHLGTTTTSRFTYGPQATSATRALGTGTNQIVFDHGITGLRAEICGHPAGTTLLGCWLRVNATNITRTSNTGSGLSIGNTFTYLGTTETGATPVNGSISTTLIFPTELTGDSLTAIETWLNALRTASS